VSIESISKFLGKGIKVMTNRKAGTTRIDTSFKVIPVYSRCLNY